MIVLYTKESKKTEYNWELILRVKTYIYGLWDGSDSKGSLC